MWLISYKYGEGKNSELGAFRQAVRDEKCSIRLAKIARKGCKGLGAYRP